MTAPPRIVSITAGGAGMFCGSCMRDNAVAAALRRMGVPLTLVPTFTPIRTDEEDQSEERVWLGGLNVYLEQRWPSFGRLPGPLRAALDHPRLLGLLSRPALQTRRRDDGLLALSLLRGEAGRQAAEVRSLVDHVIELGPDLVSLTNLLIAGFVPALQRRCDAPVVVTLQGDDIFLDDLPERHRGPVLEEMRRLARRVDGFVTFSEDYRRRMADLFSLDPARIDVVPLGLSDPQTFAPAEAAGPVRVDPGRPPTVGYLARLCPEKGLGLLVDAFLILRGLAGMEEVELRVGGWLGARDRAWFETQRRRIEKEAGAGALRVVELPDRASKIRFLQGLDVFSVPAVYREPKGLYLLEALAAGVPAVQPDHAAFAEILRRTGGGLLVPPGDARALAESLHGLLRDGEERARLGAEGAAGVAAHHGVDAMARATLAAWRARLDGGREHGVAAGAIG